MTSQKLEQALSGPTGTGLKFEAHYSLVQACFYSQHAHNVYSLPTFMKHSSSLYGLSSLLTSWLQTPWCCFASACNEVWWTTVFSLIQMEQRGFHCLVQDISLHTVKKSSLPSLQYWLCSWIVTQRAHPSVRSHWNRVRDLDLDTVWPLLLIPLSTQVVSSHVSDNFLLTAQYITFF